MPERRWVAALFLALLFSGTPRVVDSSQDPSPPGASRKIMTDERVGGFRRSFRLHVPAGLPEGEKRPLVVALHGGLATALIFEKQSGFSEVADRFGFFVAYPNGFGFYSLLRHWNGGYCCAKALKADFDDLGFLDRVIARVKESYSVDERRIYVVGYSNGGMLAHWYASERADRLAGLGIWASSIGSLETPEKSWTWPRPNAALPVFLAHGSGDRRLPFDMPGGRRGQSLLGAVGSAEAWASANGCRGEGVTLAARGGAVLRRTWCGETPHPVVFLGLEGWGHEWPGAKRTGRLRASNPLRDFHLAEEMWTFFSANP